MKHVKSLEEFFVIEVFFHRIRCLGQFVIVMTNSFFQSNHVDALGRFQKELIEIYEKDAEPLEMPRLNDLCMVKQKDMWFRAVITDILLRAKMYTVFLVDHGYDVCIESKNMYVLKEIHASIAPFICKCRLSSLIENAYTRASQMQQFICKIDSVDECLLYSDGNDVTMLVSSKLPSSNAYFLNETYGAFIAEAFETDEVFLLKQAIDRYVMKDQISRERNESVTSEDLLHLEVLRNLKFSDDDGDDDDDQVEQREQFPEWLPAMPIANIVRGVVTHITHQGTIFFMEQQNCDLAADISQQIKSIIEGLDPKGQAQDEYWRHGQPCFAKYEDGEYYRGLIVKINKGDGSCQVYN